MYKQGLRSMPRAIKKEVLRVLEIEQKDLLPLCKEPELVTEVVKELSKIKGLPSYWLVAIGHYGEVFAFPFIVFDCKLSADLEKELDYNGFPFSSLSPYYGIY